jgi:surfeit locus 1 family protein
MRIGNFRFERWPTLAVALLAPALLALGAWQLDRAEQKRALRAAFAATDAAPARAYAADAPRYARVRAAGRWDPRQFLLDAQTRAGQVGYRVLTPLALADGTLLIVDRGWVPADADRGRLPDVALAPADAAPLGRIDEFPRAGLEAGGAEVDPGAASASAPKVLLYPTPELLARALGAPVQPRMLRLAPDQPAGYARDDAPALGFPPERHQGYAATWFLLAATLLALWLRLSYAGGADVR